LKTTVQKRLSGGFKEMAQREGLKKKSQERAQERASA